MTWMLEHATVRKTFEAWGFSGLTRRLISQSPDKVTFSAPIRSFETDTAFAFNDTLKIYRPNGEQWFSGTVIQTPLNARPNAEHHGYVVAGPWWHLEENVFKQQWTTAGGPQFTGHLLLNLKAGPLLASTQEQIQAILDYLLSLYPASSKPFQVGSIEPVAFPPVSEVNAISCAAALRSQLRWVPDAVVWFDYTTDPPTIHIQQRGSLAAATLDLTSGRQDVEIVPRSDLVRPSVAVQYERTTTVNGKSHLQIINDFAPAGANGQEPRALNLSVSLVGPTMTITTAELLTEDIAPSSVDWWKSKWEILNDPRYSNIVIDDVERVLAEFDDEHEGGESVPSNQLPRELIEGQITDWMAFAYEQEVIKAKISFDFYDKDPSEEGAVKIASVKKKPISVNLVATNAITGTYQSRQTTDTGDPIPSNLAQFLYDTLKTLHFEGGIAYVGQEVDGAVGMGNVLNIAGGRAEWATMNALVQQITEQVDDGKTRISVGPPTHLGAADLMELLRVGRRFRFTPADTQDSGELGDSGNVKLGRPTANLSKSGGNSPYGLFVVKDGATILTLDATEKRVTMSQGNGRDVQIDLDDIPSLPSDSKFPVKLREIIACDENNNRKRILVLASDYWDPETGD